ncbi:FGGY-family carbohydrate kinase [Sphaerotilus sp.]|uniref:FGGY-family carbohydrate kinase n=1 Tax=Sphaerotilus sp. TaxID=2093942 RepID=UPI0034E280E8
MPPAHTLVLDIGKSNAKLVLVDAAGEVLARRVQANAPMPGPGYTALGVPRLQQWLMDSIADLPERTRIARISISTHGAAFCAIDDQGLVLPPIDYEWDGYGAHRSAFEQAIDPFAHTGSPCLPAGLNAGLQLFWLQRTQPQTWSCIHHWLPYPQYWAWWLSGVAASEVSSLGCHTQLWAPWLGRFSDWAQGGGIAARFPPMRGAGDVLGPLRPELAARWGLSPDCEVLCGVHDSNACLVRYLPLPDMTLLTTGTWTVVMSTARPEDTPVEAELFNVAVNGQPVPTARFMGGRDFDHLCAGADPAWATQEALAALVETGWEARPLPGGQSEAAFEFWRQGRRVSGGVLAVPEPLRPALAAVYCAERSATLITRLSPRGSVVVEGPLAGNKAFGLALAARLGPDRTLYRSIDAVEGTVRGAWTLGCRPTAPLQLAAII